MKIAVRGEIKVSVSPLGAFGGSSSAFNNILTYSYDKLGNIASISKNNAVQSSFVYDSAGQLIRVNDAVQNKTIIYQYDNGGNILNKKEYAYTTGDLGAVVRTVPYVYGDSNWKDKLTSYDGKAITYDLMGNPISYDGWTYVWEGGRQLKRMSKGGSTLDYRYDDSGIRTWKSINGAEINYYIVDGRVTAQETGGNWVYYRYDEEGSLISLNWQGVEYFYVRNIQGDIIGIVDELGNLVVEYAYDAWGLQISCTGALAETLGVANPFRYRGYYFDVETGLYYLQSRYYSPEWGRFVNADSVIDEGAGLIGANLFAYCANNPVFLTI